MGPTRTHPLGTIERAVRTFATAAALLALSPFCAWSAPNLVSNVDGKIQVLILHYGNGDYLGFWYDQTVVYRELLSKMDRDVAFVIVTGKDGSAHAARQRLGAFAQDKLPDGTDRVKFLEVDVETSQFYPWPRDTFLLLTDGGRNLFVLDSGFNHRPFPVTTFGSVIEGAVTWAGSFNRGGGNIRTTDDEIFVGMDTLLGIRTPIRWEYSDEGHDTLYDLARDVKPEGVPRFREVFEAHARLIHQILGPDKKMIVPEHDLFFAQLESGTFPFKTKRVRDTGAQAAFHTDVYLGLGPKDQDGRRTLFVADTGLAARIVGGMSAEERRAVERSLPGILVEEGVTAAGIRVTEAQLAERLAWDRHRLLDRGRERAEQVAARFDAAAASLAALGYRIVRVPFLPNGLTDASEGSDAIVGVAFNYSNALIEVYGDTRKAFIPVLGFKQLDDAAAAAYASAGFEVVQIKGLLTNAMTQQDANAGLDCLTSEIRFPVRWVRPGPK
jgi:hypothetical protein